MCEHVSLTCPCVSVSVSCSREEGCTVLYRLLSPSDASIAQLVVCVMDKCRAWCCGGEDGRPKCLFTRCCCCTLRTAVIVIASFEIVFCLLLSIFFALLIPVNPVLHSTGYGNLSPIAMFLQVIIHFGVACALIHGIRKNNRRLMWAWMWARGVEVVTDASKMLVFSLVVVESVEIFFIIFAVSAVTVFNIMVVRSYILELKARTDMVGPAIHYDPEMDKVEA
ncbi:hypothetical protein Pmani_007656 [Petrolisthes manimaculis]|uniref:Uncharacterized protein n=1 Tax=Petrolisthes manimaculis TaxID=1843537 RepID=A0AAE1Q744_9EUCA|nr:hypothetical protein Pmani_007656 [Petrolisthes manimaculis]